MRVEGLGAARLRRLQPGAEHQLGEVAFLFDTAEDGADLADHQLEHRDLLLEQREHLLLQGAAVTRLNTNTSRCWPMRSMRPMRCSIAIGFHGTSKLTSVLQNWMLRPSPPDSGAQQHRRLVAEVGDGGVLVRDR